jgi:hypothetical protein
MVGREINLDNIGQELRERTAMWLEEKYGPTIAEEKLDFYTEKAHQLLNDAIEISKKTGIPPEIILKSFRGNNFQ